MAGLKYSPRKSGVFLDSVHLILGTVIIVLSAFAIVRPDRYSRFFPLIFLLASLINYATGWFQFEMYPRDRRKHFAGAVYIFTGVLMFGLFVVSAISLWGD